MSHSHDETPSAEALPLVRLGQGDYTHDIYPDGRHAAPRPREHDALTATRLATLRRCPRQHYYRYQLGLSRIRTSDALRLGAAFHRGLELHHAGVEEGEAIDQAAAGYAHVPDWADPLAWRVECEVVRQLLAGHFWRYGDDDIEILEVERTFEMPLVNPETGASSRTFVLAGKIDAIVRLADGRLAVLEYKTAGEDISPDSDYWLRLRCDPQISQYVLAARALGYDVATVLYDVTRKPTISPSQIPILDDNGCKIVLDAAGKRVFNQNGKPRQSADKAKGWTLQTHVDTPEQYGVRLLTDIGDRPDYYFQRREVPRLDDDLSEFQAELWQQAKQLLDSRRQGRWFRNVHRFTCGTCEFADLCLQSVHVTPGQAPAGFQILPDVHPELSRGDDT